MLESGAEPDRARRLGTELGRRMRAYAQQTTSMAYTTRMEFYGPNGVIKGKVDLLGKRPGSFRFEGLTPSDDTVALLISDGKRFISHERGQRVCYVGRACVENVSRLIPLPFDGERLFDLLVGGAPTLLDATAEGTWDDCMGAYRLTLKAGVERQTIWLRPDIFAPIRVEMRRSGAEIFRIEYDDFGTLDGILQAQSMRYISDEKEIDLTMVLRNVERNGLNDSAPLFRTDCPAGTEGRELPCR